MMDSYQMMTNLMLNDDEFLCTKGVPLAGFWRRKQRRETLVAIQRHHT